MAYVLRILDENGYTVVEHVANHSDDNVYVNDAKSSGLPQTEWRKSHHLTNWVKENKPNWKVEEKQFGIETTLFPIL